jgi:hypothetical protein
MASTSTAAPTTGARAAGLSRDIITLAVVVALSRAETPRGTSALNAIQRIADAIGTAAFAVLLQHAITARQPGHPASAAAIGALSQQAGAHAATTLADAFGTTFWAAVALIAAAAVPALLLPRPRTPATRRRPARRPRQATPERTQ